MDITELGVSSLMAYRAALMVCSQNIANANTPEYNRRTIHFAENSFGHGVDVGEIRRIVDEQANVYARTSQSIFSNVDAYLQQLTQFEPILETDGGLKKAIQNSSIALKDLTNAAGSESSRLTFMQKLGSVASQFKDLGSEINRQLENTKESAQQMTAQINTILKKLASINESLNSDSQETIDILSDQRDSLLKDLSQFVGFKSQIDSYGVVSVTLPNGTSLVHNADKIQVTMMNDASDTGKITIGLTDSYHTYDITSGITSGSMASVVNFQQDLLSSQRSLNRIALAFGAEFNAQNKKGLDGNGMMGQDIFNDINSSTQIASRIIKYNTNTGTSDLSVQIDDVSKLTASDYVLRIGSGNTYTLTRLTDNVEVDSGTLSSSFPQTISKDGFTINIGSGTYNSGDQFTISPTKEAANTIRFETTDAKKLALAWPISISNPNGRDIKITDITDPSNTSFGTPGQLTPPIIIQFNSAGTSYDIINKTTGLPIESGIAYDPSSGANIFPTPLGFNPGYAISLKGPVSQNEIFTIDYNSKYDGANDNALAMSKLFSNRILQNSSLSFEQGYDVLASDIAGKASQAKYDYQQALQLKEDADFKREKISGVNLENEMINLSQFQQAYQASAQILLTARAVFDSLLGIIGR